MLRLQHLLSPSLLFLCATHSHAVSSRHHSLAAACVAGPDWPKALERQRSEAAQSLVAAASNVVRVRLIGAQRNSGEAKGMMGRRWRGTAVSGAKQR